MKCPNCNETLLMTERHRVEIDYCPGCRGVWLDKGELDKLLQFAGDEKSVPASKTQYDDEQAGRYTGHRDDQKHQQYPRKKKSFLSDFFDFD